MTDELWGLKDDGEWLAEDPNEIIESQADAMRSDEWAAAQITVHRYTRAAIRRFPAFLDEVIERLDEEYNAVESTDITDSMRKAAADFKAAILREYPVWELDPKGETIVVVSVLEWVKEHRPDWLKRG